MPADFVDCLRAIRPMLADELIEDQMALAYLAWVSPSKSRRHRMVEDAMTISYRELNQRFGRGKFRELNERVQLFDVTSNWSRANHLTRAFSLQSDVRHAIGEYFANCDSGLVALITMDGERLRTIPKAVASKNMSGITTKAWRDASVLNKVPIDRDALRDLRAHLKRILGDERRLTSFGGQEIDESAATVAYYLDVIGRVLCLSQTDVAGLGFLMHRYVESTSGRLYARNLNLQTVPRLIKQVALHGLWEYDFANCHYAIFAQTAARFGIPTPAVDAYLANKATTRQGIAKRNGLTIEEAKTCLLAVMYGARTSEWHEAAIPQTIGPQRARRLYRDPTFEALQSEVQEVGKAIVAAWPERRRGLIVNAAGYGMSAHRAPKYLLAHLLQGAEATMLRSIVDAYPHDILLLQHDGFASRSRLDVRELEKIVHDATGYRMALEETQLTLPPELERSILLSHENHCGDRSLRRNQAPSVSVNGSLAIRSSDPPAGPPTARRHGQRSFVGRCGTNRRSTPRAGREHTANCASRSLADRRNQLIGLPPLASSAAAAARPGRHRRQGYRINARQAQRDADCEPAAAGQSPGPRLDSSTLSEH